MFEKLETAPPDPILGLTEAYRADPNPQKINLGVGVYKDAQGNTPVLASVKAAEQHIWRNESTKNYLPPSGSPDYGELVQSLLFGPGHDVVLSGRVSTAQTPGGTGALRLTGDYLKKLFPQVTIWLPDPTWPNHSAVFAAAQMTTATYPYFDAATNALAFGPLIEALGKVAAGDVVLLHGCCHNPSGTDPTIEQWQQIGQTLAQRGGVPLIDFAYQGFGAGLDPDAQFLRQLTSQTDEMFICSSYSKNFGLYNERVGALTVVAGSSSCADVVLSHLKSCARANYSNPPTHGAAIVTTVLSEPDLRQQWEVELQAMCARINKMRQLFIETMAAHSASADFSFLGRQKGMFSFSGLSGPQVKALRENYSIYIVGSGRINVAGMTESNMQPLCRAIACVCE